MISNQILQNTIDGLKGISRVDFAVVDTDGKDVVSTLESDKGYVSSVADFVFLNNWRGWSFPSAPFSFAGGFLEVSLL